MIQKVSTTYSKEHCTCYDEYEDNVLVAVMIEPESGYKLRYAEGEDSYDISGFALINANALDSFDRYSAVEESTLTPTEDEEISDSEVLSIIISGGNDSDESGS